MDYKEKIKSAIARVNESASFEIEISGEAIEAFNKKKQEDEELLRLLIQQYFDTKLKDNHPSYKVIERGMDSLFGRPLLEPSAMFITYQPSLGLGRKTKILYTSELQELQILFLALVEKSICGKGI